MRTKVFIGSSAEGLRIAQGIKAQLDHKNEVTIWHENLFQPSSGTLSTLVTALESFDFAILVLTPDDTTTSRQNTSQSPRDNVIFELGLFGGGIGFERTFVVYDRTKDIKIPSDLAGITPVTFQEHSDNNIVAAVGSAAFSIQEAINRLGNKSMSLLKKDYGIKILFPKDQEDVTSPISVSGSFITLPPQGSVMAFIHNRRSNEFWPKREVAFDEKKHTWNTEVDINSVTNETRDIVIVTVGEFGRELIEYRQKVGKEHGAYKGLKLTGKFGEDIHIHDRVTVKLNSK